MPFIKDPLSLLIETAETDIRQNTAGALRESTVRSNYASIESISESITYDPRIVPVINVNGEYFTEMNFLYPFMKSNNIKSISEALETIAEANNIDEIGILIESNGSVQEMISDAIKNGNKKMLDKIDDATNRVKNLTRGKKGKKGIKVKRKADKKPCPECGKINCECGKATKECGKNC